MQKDASEVEHKLAEAISSIYIDMSHDVDGIISELQTGTYKTIGSLWQRVARFFTEDNACKATLVTYGRRCRDSYLNHRHQIDKLLRVHYRPRIHESADTDQAEHADENRGRNESSVCQGTKGKQDVNRTMFSIPTQGLCSEHTTNGAAKQDTTTNNKVTAALSITSEFPTEDSATKPQTMHPSPREGSKIRVDHYIKNMTNSHLAGAAQVLDPGEHNIPVAETLSPTILTQGHDTGGTVHLPSDHPRIINYEYTKTTTPESHEFRPDLSSSCSPTPLSSKHCITEPENYSHMQYDSRFSDREGSQAPAHHKMIDTDRRDTDVGVAKFDNDRLSMDFLEIIDINDVAIMPIDDPSRGNSNIPKYIA